MALSSFIYHHALSEGAKSDSAVSPPGANPSRQVTISEDFTLTFTWLLLSYHESTSGVSHRETQGTENAFISPVWALKIC